MVSVCVFVEDRRSSQPSTIIPTVLATGDWVVEAATASDEDCTSWNPQSAQPFSDLHSPNGPQPASFQKLTSFYRLQIHDGNVSPMYGCCKIVADRRMEWMTFWNLGDVAEGCSQVGGGGFDSSSRHDFPEFLLKFLKKQVENRQTLSTKALKS